MITHHRWTNLDSILYFEEKIRSEEYNAKYMKNLREQLLKCFAGAVKEFRQTPDCENLSPDQTFSIGIEIRLMPEHSLEF